MLKGHHPDKGRKQLQASSRPKAKGTSSRAEAKGTSSSPGAKGTSSTQGGHRDIVQTMDPHAPYGPLGPRGSMGFLCPYSTHGSPIPKVPRGPMKLKGPTSPIGRWALWVPWTPRARAHPMCFHYGSRDVQYMHDLVHHLKQMSNTKANSLFKVFGASLIQRIA